MTSNPKQHPTQVDSRLIYYWQQLSVPKVIVAVFALYMGFVFTQSIDQSLITFIYMLIVMVVWWRSMQWLIRHGQVYAQQQKKQKVEVEKLKWQQKGLAWIQTNIDKEATPIQKRKYSFAQTYIAAINDWPLERIRQIDLAESRDRTYQWIEQSIERQEDHFLWVSIQMTVDQKGKTILSKIPLHLDSAQFTHYVFAKEMKEALDFTDLYIYSSEFMHAYQVLGKMVEKSKKEQWANYQSIVIVDEIIHGILSKIQF